MNIPSLYYKYDFISPEATYALVEEELSSYFNTGSCDASLFSLWTNQCLQKLGKSSFPILEQLVIVENSEARLPDDFHAVREAWMCSDFVTKFPAANADYSYTTTSRLDEPDLYCSLCEECETPNIIKAIFKTTHETLFTFRRTHLLKPGNVKTADNCGLFTDNQFSTSLDTYDIRGNKLYTNFKEGKIYLVYYSKNFDCNDNQLIPDDYRVIEFIKAFLKQKIFEQLFNQSTDETFNQSYKKYELYKQMSDEAFILADTETKKETIEKKVRGIKRVLSRNQKFDIP